MCMVVPNIPKVACVGYDNVTDRRDTTPPPSTLICRGIGPLFCGARPQRPKSPLRLLRGRNRAGGQRPNCCKDCFVEYEDAHRRIAPGMVIVADNDDAATEQAENMLDGVRAEYAGW